MTLCLSAYAQVTVTVPTIKADIDTTKLTEEERQLLRTLRDKKPLRIHLPMLPIPNIDIVEKANNFITQYYGKDTFDEPDWVRVKNFLTWMNRNKSSLNAAYKPYLFKNNISFGIASTDIFIAAYLGANYVSQNIISEKFDLPIKMAYTCEAKHSEMCIQSEDPLEAINIGIHEAVHLLRDNKYGEDNKRMLSEAVTVFSQLKYGVPIKNPNRDIRYGCRNTFMFADEEFVCEHETEILNEYADIALSIINYSQYSRNPASVLRVVGEEDKVIADIVRILLYRKSLASTYGNGVILNKTLLHDMVSDYENRLSEYDKQFLTNPFYEDTVNEIYASMFEKDLNKFVLDFHREIVPHFNYYYGANQEEDTFETRFKKEYNKYFQELFKNNLSEIANIIVINLRKHADANIPPVPEGYM